MIRVPVSWLKRTGQLAAVMVIIAIGLPLLDTVFAEIRPGHLEVPLPVVTLGTIIGIVYGLLGVGLVLVYRTNRIINFAHGEIGAFGAAVFGVFVVQWHIPYWIAFPFGLAVSGGIAAIAETGVVRRLRKAPNVMSVVATLGVGQLVFTFAAAINATASVGSLYPQPSFLPEFELGALLVTPSYTGMMILGPILVVGLALFLRRSRYGLALRAAAAAPETARMAGVFSSRMSTLAWALAGGLSAFTAIMMQPTMGFSGAQAFGPTLLLRALAAAAIGRMSSLPGALVAGIGIGVLEQLLLWNFEEAGLVQVALFVIILTALVMQRTRGGREEEERGSWAVVQALRPIPDALRSLWVVRNMGPILGVLSLAVAALLPLFITNAVAVVLSGIFALGIIGLSLGIVTGLGGQLSLGQFAVAAIGAVVSFHVTSNGGTFVFGFLYAGLVAALVSLLLGLPALRSKGLMLTVTTLSFALIAPTWLLSQPWMLGEGATPIPPQVFGVTLDTGLSYYYLSLGVLLVALVIARNIRRSGLGRVLTAVRDNEDNARAFTVRASVVKMQGFVLAGFLAGIAGALYFHGLARVTEASFPSAISIAVVTMTVIGGLGIMSGPLLGALFVIGVPEFVSLDAAALAASAFGQLVIILYLPGGLAQLVEPLRDRFVRLVGKRAGVDVERAYAEATPTGAKEVGAAGGIKEFSFGRERRRPERSLLLRASGLHKFFGGVHAVEDVSFDVHVGEIVGLIGPNGAGKTTTFEVISGFLRPDAGAVWFDGQDVTLVGPEARGRLGLVRSFQDSALFPTMTVTDAVAVALERNIPTTFFSSVAGFSIKDRNKQARAREIIDLMGLVPYRHMQIRELSTGTRRITEIACLVAARPTLLLFDEPSTGIAQRETEALGDLLRRIKDALGVTLVVIEHDMPLIMGLADRIIAMADGKVIASGPPEMVQRDPLVVEAYLGGTASAIERSGPVTPGPEKAVAADVV